MTDDTTPLGFLEWTALTLGYLAASVGVVFDQIHGVARVLADVAICVYLIWGAIRFVGWVRARRRRRAAA